MSVIPRIAPIIGDPQAAQRLSARWQRARSLLLISSVALPSALTLVCVSFAGLTAFGPDDEVVGWSVIPVLAAGACAVSLVVWLRRDGLTDPHSWVPATVLMTTSELVLGVIPGFGLTARYATGIAAKALLAIGVLGAGAAWATARLARHCLVGSPVPELGSTEFRLVLGNKPTRLVIEADGSSGPRARAAPGSKQACASPSCRACRPRRTTPSSCTPRRVDGPFPSRTPR